MFIFRFLTFVIVIISIPVFLANKISPAIFWPAGFATYLIPPLLIVDFLLFIFWIFKKSLTTLLLVPPLIIGFPYINKTISIHKQAGEKGEISVLSYNVRVFNVYTHLRKERPQIAREMMEWINSDNSDIKCFQDFYNDNNSDLYNSLPRLAQKGKYKYYFTKTTKNRIGATFGLAIFTKYPILKFGNINFESSFNKGVYVDLKIKNDTIRVINIHLESMSIDENALLSREGAKGSLTYLMKVLKNGMMKRAQQLDEVEKVIIASPHRIILCGDLNDMPYTYTYRKLSSYLNNSFEDVGNGLGFSYNGKLFFLRIDNQFYSDGIKVKTFETLRNINYSDHFPLKATYSLE
jgi:endonuclease/exonuclease/phosphatase family metal-dependent hydrolase